MNHVSSLTVLSSCADEKTCKTGLLNKSCENKTREKQLKQNSAARKLRDV